MTPWPNFDLAALTRPGTPEATVREAIITPLLRALGYLESGAHRIKRDLRLLHPFVYIGTRRVKVDIIPDYLLIRCETALCILDAKAPKERIHEGKHVEQAYSYAMHKDVRVRMYALCNGLEFALFHVSRWGPILHFDLDHIGHHWDALTAYIGATGYAEAGLSAGMLPDLGLHLRKIGYWKADDGTLLVQVFMFLLIQNVTLRRLGQYSITTVVGYEGQAYTSTFDFTEEHLALFLHSLLPKCRKLLEAGLVQQPFQVFFEPEQLCVTNVMAEIGEEIFSNADESYCPFRVMAFPASDLGPLPEAMLRKLLAEILSAYSPDAGI